jgi:hypothetical protein
MIQHNSGLGSAAAAARPKPGTSVCGEAIIDAQNFIKSAPKNQARSRAYRQYSIMRLLRDHGLAADCVSLSAGPPYNDITAQVLGRDFVVEAANAGDDFPWLKGRDVLVVRADREEALCIIPLRLAAEIAVAAEDRIRGLPNAPVAERLRHRGRKAGKP